MAGRVGRPSLPSNVHVLRGNLSKKPVAELLDGFQPDVELAECPPHLIGEASKEYQRLGAELVRYNLVSAIDRGTLAMIATLWARYVWAEEKILSRNTTDPSGEAGLVAKAPSGYKVMSVYVQISNAAMQQYLKLASEFGLTPAARSRVTPSGAPQLPLPGIDEEPQQTAPTIRSFAA